MTATTQKRRWLIPRWIAELLAPTPGCDCETCEALRQSYARIHRQTQVPPRAVNEKARS